MEITIESFVKRNAYSYIRFSSAAQSEGDSFRRQMSRTEEFCEDNELELNKTRYEDLGVSGWTGENMEKGALGDFLHAVKLGKVPKGSVLVVENLDRFSRLPPRTAYNKLAEIIELGVDVVTLEDRKFHTKDTLDDFATLMSSFAIMQRAHDESSRKSRLVQQALDQKRKMAMAGKEILNSRCPAWLRAKADKSGFEFIPERVAVLQRIIGMMKDGRGKREIARTLNAEAVPTWGSTKRSAKEWEEHNILAVTKSRSLVGELQLDQRKKQKGPVIPGYYPAVIDEKTWQAIQPDKREHTSGPQSNVLNLFAGLLHDGYHPHYRMKVTIGIGRDRTYYYMQSDYRRNDPACADYDRDRKKKVKGRKLKLAKPLSCETLNYEEFEKHVLQHFEGINFSEMLPRATAAETSRADVLKAEKRKAEKAAEKLLAMVEQEDGGDSVLVMGRIRELETNIKRLAKELAVEEQRAKKERLTMDGFELEQKRLEELINASTREARLSLRALFLRIMTRIDVYTAGLFGDCGHIPEDLKDVVYPDRVGMTCYCISMVGGYKMWFWWDGRQTWLEPGAEMPPALDKLDME